LDKSESVEILQHNSYDYGMNTYHFSKAFILFITEALGRELAAKFYLTFGKTDIAETYLTKAYACYSRYGAIRKVKDLEEKYPQLIVCNHSLTTCISEVIPTKTTSSSGSSEVNTFEEDCQLAVCADCDDFVRTLFPEKDVFEKMAHYLGVQYVYAETAACNEQYSSLAGELRQTLEIADSPPSTHSIEEALAQMSAEWVAKLHTAALSAREKQVCKLIVQIPPENAALAEALAKKVYDFRLDQIIDLTSNG